MIVAIHLKKKKTTRAHGTVVANSWVFGVQHTGPSLGLERALVPTALLFHVGWRHTEQKSEVSYSVDGEKRLSEPGKKFRAVLLMPTCFEVCLGVVNGTPGMAHGAQTCRTLAGEGNQP